MQGVFISGEDPDILCLHSSMSNSRQWQLLSQSLAGGRGVIAVDFYGYGDAPSVPDNEQYTLATEAKRIIALLDELNIIQPITVIGHSMGGAVALKLAHEHPQRFKELMLFEPVAFHLLPKDDAGREEIEVTAQSVIDEDDRTGAQTFVDYWNFPGFFNVLPESTQQRFVHEVAKVRLEFSALIGEAYTLDDYQNITLPVKLIYGSSSRKSAHHVVEQLKNTLPNVDAVEVEGGHMAPIANAAAVNDVILQHLQKKQ